MFQPHPTPYSPFSSYGAVSDFHSFQPSSSSPLSAARSGLVADSGGPTIVRNPIFSPINGNAANANSNNLNFTTNPSLGPQFDMNSDGIDDREQQEELARCFQPNLQGPLVGKKRSSHAIAEEYAKADPVYVAKTAALPQKYSHYRPILGDGNCGWRAAGFSYFETLLRTQDNTQLEEEIARLTSLNNLLTTIGGFQEWLFEDMVEETTNLLRDLAVAIQTSPQTAADLLIERFNNREVSDAIVYHFRLLASSWMKGYPAAYQDFIQDNLGVDGYRKEWLEAPNQEIDHLGMTLLIDFLLKPIGFAVEIVYLDRTEGAQVNVHLIQAEENGVPTNPDGPIVHLLYRPSHYDILYKDMAAPMPMRQAISEATPTPNIQVNRATSFSQQHSVQSTSMNDFSSIDMTELLSIPGFQCAPPPSHHGYPAQFQSQSKQTYTSSPISASVSPISAGASSTTTSSNTNLSLSTNFPPQQATTLISPTLSTPHSTTFSPSSIQLPIHSGVSQPHISPHPLRPSIPSHSSISSQHSDLPSPSSATSPFRPSRWEWDARVAEQDGPVVFQTSTFKNSHYNTAHYNNPNFQPEEWSPECEEASGHASSSNVARKRSN